MTRRILLCDDEIHILRAAEFKLSRAGYQVRCATDGQQAWETLLAEPFDLLVTDCQMPRLNGLELVRRLRQDETLHRLPVMMLTAKGLELSHGELAEQLRVAAVISKPFSPRELLRQIDQTLSAAGAAAPTTA